MNTTINLIAKQAKQASNKLATIDNKTKNKVLLAIRNALIANQEKILEENAKDLENAVKLLENNEIKASVYNRLKLDEDKLQDMIHEIEGVIMLEDPVGKVLIERELDENLLLKKITVPIGVIGVIFEARPDVITQISALAIKSGNAVILKGGKEAVNTNRVLLGILNSALKGFPAFPEGVLNQVFTHADVEEMLKAEDDIDLIIPRGSNHLVKYIKKNTNIPVLGHADGVCHIYIDETASLEIAKAVVVDAKCQYPAACNAVETLLINDKFKWTVDLLAHLKNNGIELIDKPTTYAHEYGEKKLALRTVISTDEAIFHINKFGSHHTDCIISRDEANIAKFMNEVDSAGVYANVSTRFADGYRYGFGAEVGISTNKTHARGPVGVEGLTIYKYTLEGKGQIVADYASGKKSFHHKDLI